MIPTQILNTHCRSQVHAISSLYAFELTHASIRTFEGCNVAWFTGFLEKKIFRLKIFGARPFSMMFFSPKFNYLDTNTHLSRGVMMVEEPIQGFLDTTATHIWSFGT